RVAMSGDPTLIKQLRAVKRAAWQAREEALLAYAKSHDEELFEAMLKTLHESGVTDAEIIRAFITSSSAINPSVYDLRGERGHHALDAVACRLRRGQPGARFYIMTVNVFAHVFPTESTMFAALPTSPLWAWAAKSAPR